MFSDLIWFVFGIFLTYQSVLLDLSFWKDEYGSPALNIDQMALHVPNPWLWIDDL